MADTSTDDEQRSEELAKLELPSLSLPGFGRRKKQRDRVVAEEPEPVAEEPVVEEPVAEEPEPPAPTPARQAEPVHEPEPVGQTPEPESDAVTEPEPDRSTRTRSFTLPRLGRRRAEPVADVATPVAPVAPSVHEEPEPQSAVEPVHSTLPAPLPVAAPAADLETVSTPVTTGAADPELEPSPVVVDEPPSAEEEPGRQRRTFALPPLSGRLAALVTGLVVGVFGTVLTYVTLQGCNAVRGTETCGGTGLLLLLVILVLMVLLGGVMLAAWSISDARSTSFLAVGVLCVIELLTYMSAVQSAWMFFDVPVISALSYLLAHWVTTTFIEPSPEPGPDHDVR